MNDLPAVKLQFNKNKTSYKSHLLCILYQLHSCIKKTTFLKEWAAKADIELSS